MRIKLLAFRKQQGLNQKEFAQKLDITHNHLSRIETGASEPSLKLINKFSEVFNLKVEEAIKLFEKC